MYISLYCKGSNRVTQSFTVRGSWRPNKDCNILTPTLMAISVVSFSFSRAAQWEARGLSFLLSAGFLYLVLSLTTLVPQLTDFLSSPSYIIVQSPTQSLEWHVWSSSSGNNCHAVHRSISSGASVYVYHGLLPCPMSSAKSAYAISSHNCHRNVSLPSGASLWNGMFGRVEVNIQYMEHPN